MYKEDAIKAMKDNKHVKVLDPNEQEHFGFLFQKTPQMIRDEFPDLKINNLEREMIENICGFLWTYSLFDTETHSYPATLEEQIRRCDLANKKSMVNHEWYRQKYSERSVGRHYPEYGLHCEMNRSRLDLVIKVLNIEDRMLPFDKEKELGEYSK